MALQAGSADPLFTHPAAAPWTPTWMLSTPLPPSLQGDYHRYLAEFKTGAERKEAAEHTLLAYKAAQVRSCWGQVLLLGCGLCK